MLVTQSLWKLAYLGEITLVTKLYLPFLDHTPSLSHAVKMASPGEMIPTPRLGLVFLKCKSAVTALRLAGFILMLELACTNLLPASSATNHSQSPSPPEPMSWPL